MVEPLRYETIPIGQVVGPFAYVVPRDFNERRLAAFSGRDLSDCFTAEHGDFAEPSFLYGQHSWVMRKHFSWAGSVHAKCDVDLEAPVRPGATIHVTGRIADKYERRGGRYAVFEMTTIDDSGQLVCTVRNSMLLNFREVVTRRRETRADPPAASKSLAGGESRQSRAGRLVRAEAAGAGRHPEVLRRRGAGLRSAREPAQR